jgi:hypothetical protein
VSAAPAERVRVCECLAPLPAEIDRGVFICDACGDLLPPPGLAQFDKRLTAVEGRLTAIETAPAPEEAADSWLSYKEAALLAGKHHDTIRKRKTEFGFDADSSRVRRSAFLAALKNRDGIR